MNTEDDEVRKYFIENNCLANCTFRYEDVKNNKNYEVVPLSINIYFLKPNEWRFSCKQCGNCCIDNDIEVLMSEIEQIKAYTKRDDFYVYEENVREGCSFYRIKKKGLKCMFLDKKNKCRIYPVRPITCRKYPFDMKVEMIDGLPVFLIGFLYQGIDGVHICSGIVKGEFKHEEIIRIAKVFEQGKRQMSNEKNKGCVKEIKEETLKKILEEK